MSSSPARTDRTADRAPASLRERKKAKTRRTIQEQALRLFAEQGYEATTIEQIAAAAEVSPSTFFRYFPTKEDVIAQDDFDPLLLEKVRAQPPDLSPVAAIRAALRAAFSVISEAELEQVRVRINMMMSIPAVRAKSVDNLLATIDMITSVVAERTGRAADSPEVHSLAGAVLGVLLSALYRSLDQDDPRVLPDLVDEALGHLEAGLPV